MPALLALHVFIPRGKSSPTHFDLLAPLAGSNDVRLETSGSTGEHFLHCQNHQSAHSQCNVCGFIQSVISSVQWFRYVSFRLCSEVVVVVVVVDVLVSSCLNRVGWQRMAKVTVRAKVGRTRASNGRRALMRVRARFQIQIHNISARLILLLCVLSFPRSTFTFACKWLSSAALAAGENETNRQLIIPHAHNRIQYAISIPPPPPFRLQRRFVSFFPPVFVVRC